DYDLVTAVPQVANLSLTKIINNPTPNVGDTVTFTITVNNAGPDAATAVVIEDAIPNGYANIRNISNAGSLLNDTLTWSIANIASAASQVLTYQATVFAPISSTNISNPTANPLVTTTYIVTKTNLTNSFTATDSITVTVETTIPSVNAGADFTKTCVLNPNGAVIGEPNETSSSYSWSPALGLSNAVGVSFT
ncbi:DUF11 domain-containing protein, partial [Lacihabitans sp. CCS-44]|uniref:DUF11 domain-containing protein n=1 Tax=Lacihabitans sp. CCS-44 TaxID=2487331 RepID=UPI0020CFB327